MSAKVHVDLVTVCFQLHLCHLPVCHLGVCLHAVCPASLLCHSAAMGLLSVAWLPGCHAYELVARLGVWFCLTLSASLLLVVYPSTSCLPVCP